jgi:hypothetical protein
VAAVEEDGEEQCTESAHDEIRPGSADHQRPLNPEKRATWWTSGNASFDPYAFDELIG